MLNNEQIAVLLSIIALGATEPQDNKERSWLMKPGQFKKKRFFKELKFLHFGSIESSGEVEALRKIVHSLEKLGLLVASGNSLRIHNSALEIGALFYHSRGDVNTPVYLSSTPVSRVCSYDQVRQAEMYFEDNPPALVRHLSQILRSRTEPSHLSGFVHWEEIENFSKNDLAPIQLPAKSLGKPAWRQRVQRCLNTCILLGLVSKRNEISGRSFSPRSYTDLSNEEIENTKLEYKEALFHNTRNDTKHSDEAVSKILSRTVCAFLNQPQNEPPSTLVCGLTDDLEYVGIEADFPYTANKKASSEAARKGTIETWENAARTHLQKTVSGWLKVATQVKFKSETKRIRGTEMTIVRIEIPGQVRPGDRLFTVKLPPKDHLECPYCNARIEKGQERSCFYRREGPKTEEVNTVDQMDSWIAGLLHRWKDSDHQGMDASQIEDSK